MTCLHATLDPQECEDIREAAERVFDKAIEPLAIAEWVELVLDEADALERRRELAIVKTCPHCGEVL